jgi:predicted porin
MRLDAEGSQGAADALHPWAEDALGVYAFGYQSNSRLDTGGTPPAPVGNDVANVFGLGGRGQYGSAELNVGFYNEAHNHGTDTGSKVTAQVGFAELSYVVFPWMVPAVRIEHVSLKPEGGSRVSDLHIQPGVAFLIRPNIKLVAVFNYESASGFPTTGTGSMGWQGGASGWGPLQIAPPASGKTSLSEFETVGLFLAWAM